MTAETITTRRASTPNDCVHHWIVEPAGGPKSRGRCKYCGSQRSFSNSTETALEEVMKLEDSPRPPMHRWR